MQKHTKLKDGSNKSKFLFFGYRSWAEEIFSFLNKSDFGIDSYTIKDTEYSNLTNTNKILLDPKNLEDINFEKYKASFFCGWSWIIPSKIVENYDCVCLHPSLLPKYRGGSPLQHQIINGESESAVSLFKMGEGLDDGPLYYQKKFSLEGNLKEIFSRISKVGSNLIYKLMRDFDKDEVSLFEQNHSEATYYKRRRPSESELSQEMIKNKSALDIYNFIRALQKPYPTAFIKGKDGKKIYLKESSLIS